MLDALPAWTVWRDEIVQTIAAAGSPDKAATSLDAWSKRAADDEDIASSIYTSSLQADMAGQLFVRTVEAPETAPLRALAVDVEPSFLSLTFEEALSAFLERRIITPEEFRALSDAARTRAFTATGLASDELRRRAYDSLTRALSEGQTYEQFVADLRDGAVSLGIEPQSPDYLDNVYRTNVQSAYGAGRYRQITSPAVQAARPFIEYRTAGDSRVRPAHARLHRKLFRQDDPGWPRLAPPNGFRCRCAVVSRRARDVSGREIANAADYADVPTPGFDTAPFVTLTE